MSSPVDDEQARTVQAPPIPITTGQPSSETKRALERMDAMLSETDDDGVPVAYNKVAGVVVVVGNEDGAHHVIADVAQALMAGPIPAPPGS